MTHDPNDELTDRLERLRSELISPDPAPDARINDLLQSDGDVNIVDISGHEAVDAITRRRVPRRSRLVLGAVAAGFVLLAGVAIFTAGGSTPSSQVTADGTPEVVNPQGLGLVDDSTTDTSVPDSEPQDSVEPVPDNDDATYPAFEDLFGPVQEWVECVGTAMEGGMEDEGFLWPDLKAECGNPQFLGGVFDLSDCFSNTGLCEIGSFLELEECLGDEALTTCLELDTLFGDLDFGDLDFGDLDFGDLDFGDLDFGDLDFGDLDFGDLDFGDLDLGDLGELLDRFTACAESADCEGST